MRINLRIMVYRALSVRDLNVINLYINGKKEEVESERLIDLLTQKFCATDKFAVAVNEQFINRQSYSDFLLKEGDKLELVVPVQGG